MSDLAYLTFFTCVLSLAVGGIFLIYPWIVRKGLLFGVYVGEKTFSGEQARRITASWYRWMIVAIFVSILLGIISPMVVPNPLVPIAPLLLQLLAFTLLYLRAYFQAKSIALDGPPPAAAAPLVSPAPAGVVFPTLAMVWGAALGLLALVYAWVNYDLMPAKVPTHFGPSGTPDAWSAKSFNSVMMLPFMTLFLGVSLGGIALLTAGAKRAIRLSDQGASLGAQLKFRRAMANFLSGVAVLTSAMMALLSVSSVQVAMGQREGLSWAGMALGIGVGAYALIGTLYLAFRYGQGGARMERASEDTPLTNGLADNRYWVLGMFYVNRDDPSILVERRFGFGYTLNFGNWKAVLLLVVFLGVILGIAIAGAMSGR